MNILIIQEYSRHKENINYRECLCFERAFKALGHNATSWGLGHPNYEQKINFNDFDVIFCLENYGDYWIPNLSEYKEPLKIFYAIDPHVRGIEPYNQIVRDKGFDHMFCAIESFCNKDTLYIPPSVDENLIYNKNIERDIDFGFVGNYVNEERKNLIESCARIFNLNVNIFKIGDEMVNLLNRFKISFNKNISYEGLNYRNFESIACGALLITSENKDLEKMGFKHEKNCLIYKDINDIRSFFPMKKQVLVDIAAAGEELSKQHTYKERCKQIIQFIEKYK